MPTWERLARFDRDYANLSSAQKVAFKRAVKHFVADLERGEGFRKGLRVKGVRGATSVYEMTWAGDGRATFSYGTSVREGETHIVWRRIGSHDILS